METETQKKNDTKKAYLRRYQSALMAERELAEEIDELRASVMLPSSGMGDGMPRGSGGGDLSGYMVKLDKLQADLLEQLDKRAVIRKEIVAAIEVMAKEPEKVLLRYRYIMGYRWEVIADKMHYSLRNVYELHGTALRGFKIPERVQ